MKVRICINVKHVTSLELMIIFTLMSLNTYFCHRFNCIVCNEGIDEKYVLDDINYKFLQTFQIYFNCGDLVVCTLNEVIFLSLYSLTFDI